MGRLKNPGRQQQRSRNTLSLNLKKMGYNKKQLKEQMKPLYGFGGKRIELVGVITLPVSFGTPKNPCTTYITFDVVYMLISL
jgi:hypothetical protein